MECVCVCENKPFILKTFADRECVCVAVFGTLGRNATFGGIENTSAIGGRWIVAKQQIHWRWFSEFVEGLLKALKGHFKGLFKGPF